MPFWFAIVLAALLLGCADDDELLPPTPPPEPEPVPTVQLDWAALPYDSLSTYGFFSGNMSDMVPVEEVLPYVPVNKLFTDYVHKKRYVWMPASVSAQYVADTELLDFPDSTFLIKHFYYEDVQPSGNRRILETRLLYKLQGEWHFANYVWNNGQTAALYDMDGNVTHVEWTEPGKGAMEVDYRIPSESECFTCHKSNDNPVPIALKPQSLNTAYQFKEGVKNQLQKWEEMGYLMPGYPEDIHTLVDWQNPDAELVDRVRSYMDMNCGHCHSQTGHCSYRSLRLDYASTADPTNMGLCIPPDEFLPGQPQLEYIIAAGKPLNSALLFRLESTEENERMPLLGRTLVNEEAVELITEYIESLDEPCE